MDNELGLIRWVARPVDGEPESGETHLRLSDFSILRRVTTRRENTMIEALKGVGLSQPEPLPPLGEIAKQAAETLERLGKQGLGKEADEVEEVWYSKRATLSDRYTLVNSEHDAKTHSGFGIGIDVAEWSCFCWEWFDLQGSNVWKKRQESGAIRIEHVDTPNGSEIAKMAFESDVSMRVMRGMSWPVKFDLRLDILEGSYITWPFLVNGEIVVPG